MTASSSLLFITPDVVERFVAHSDARVNSEVAGEESEETIVDREEMLAYNRRNDPWPFHVDEAAAARTPYGGLIASGRYTVS